MPEYHSNSRMSRQKVSPSPSYSTRSGSGSTFLLRIVALLSSLIIYHHMNVIQPVQSFHLPHHPVSFLSRWGYRSKIVDFTTSTTTPRSRSRITSSSFAASTSGGTVSVDPLVTTIDIGDEIGSGSYGTVYSCTFSSDNEKETNEQKKTQMIAKRAWTKQELQQRLSKEKQKENNEKYLKEKSKRCDYYFQVEQHCFEKLMLSETETDDSLLQIPKLLGVYKNSIALGEEGESQQYSWMVFELIQGSTTNNNDGNNKKEVKIAKTLQDMITSDWKDQHTNNNNKDDESHHHHLYQVQKELGLSFPSSSSSLEQTLDHIFLSLLNVLDQIHSLNIVHRDIKPSNLLCDPNTQNLILIDFGSAADLDPIETKTQNWFMGKNKQIGLEDDSIVAISPMYCAPELFIKAHKSPLNYDVYSTCLIFCQLLFNLLEERQDASFHQQLSSKEEGINHDLDVWLQMELRAKVRLNGLENGLMYLGQRPGMWDLFKRMLHPNPERRISSKEALKTLKGILKDVNNDIDLVDTEASSSRIAELDGIFFESVLNSLEICDISYDDDLEINEDDVTTTTTTTTENTVTTKKPARMIHTPPRPLHYMKTFQKDKPIGLILSEATNDNDNDDEDSLLEEEFDGDQTSFELWKKATQNAREGEVFVKGFVEGGQALAQQIQIQQASYDRNRIEIGDKLSGIGEVPFLNQGFEKAVQMITNQPQSTNIIKLHFDRQRGVLVGNEQNLEDEQAQQQQDDTMNLNINDDTEDVLLDENIRVVDQGAWSIKGRRNTQEDAFVLNEIHFDNNSQEEEEERSILFAGVFDGHCGTAASKTLSQVLPSLFSTEMQSQLLLNNSDSESSSSSTSSFMKKALSSSWKQTCESYQKGCDDADGLCIADYDPVEGIIMAHTGTKDWIAGSTGTIALIESHNNNNNNNKARARGEELLILNCGDSRTMVLGKEKKSKRNNDNDNETTTKIPSFFNNNKRPRRSRSVVHFCTRDHSPKDPLETKRLTEGKLKQGFEKYSLPECSFNKYWLQIGDYQYAVARSLEGTFAHERGIVYEPDMYSLTLSSSSSSSSSSLLLELEKPIVLLASDGLFESMENEEVGLLAIQMREEYKMSASEIAKNLCQKAYEKGSSDNVSVVIIFLE